MGNDRCGPSACQRGQAKRLLPVVHRPSAKAPRSLKVRASLARDQIRGVYTGRVILPVRRLHVPPQQLGRPAEGADGMYLPRRAGCTCKALSPSAGREREGLLAAATAPLWSPIILRTYAIWASTRPSRARSSSPRARASASPSRTRHRPCSPQLGQRAILEAEIEGQYLVSPSSGRVIEGLEGLLVVAHPTHGMRRGRGPGAGLRGR